MAVAVCLALCITYQSVLKNTYYIEFSLSSELLVVCEKDRKEGANVYVSRSRRDTIRASQLLISWGYERKLNIVVTEKICSGCPCIPKTSPAACFVLPRCDSCLAEVLALLGTSSSLLINLKK